MPVAYGSANSLSEQLRTNSDYIAPSGIADGDLLFIWHLEYLSPSPAPTPTPPDGFAQVPGTWPRIESTGGEYRVYLWYKFASSESGDPYTVTHSSCTTRGIIARVIGAHQTTPFLPDPTQNSAKVNPSNYLGLTTTVDGCLIIAFGADDNDSSNNLVPPAITQPTLVERIDTPGEYLATANLATAGATGDGTQTNNSTPGTPWFAVLMSVQPDTGGPSAANMTSTLAGVGSLSPNLTVSTTGGVTVDDIEYRLGGGATNADPNVSLSGAMSTSAGGLITGGAQNNLWDNVSSAEALSGEYEYRLLYIKNNHASATWSNPTIWIDSPPAQGDYAIALDSAAIGSTAASSCANENTAPTGGGAPYTFTSPTTKAAGISLGGDLGPGQYKAIWVRRHINASTPGQSDAESIRTEST